MSRSETLKKTNIVIHTDQQIARRALVNGKRKKIKFKDSGAIIRGASFIENSLLIEIYLDN